MCMMRKVNSVETVTPEIIKDPIKADASVEKANAENRSSRRALASENIKTSNLGADEDVITSKKKLLGE